MLGVGVGGSRSIGDWGPIPASARTGSVPCLLGQVPSRLTLFPRVVRSWESCKACIERFVYRWLSPLGRLALIITPKTKNTLIIRAKQVMAKAQVLINCLTIVLRLGAHFSFFARLGFVPPFCSDGPIPSEIARFERTSWQHARFTWQKSEYIWGVRPEPTLAFEGRNSPGRKEAPRFLGTGIPAT